MTGFELWICSIGSNGSNNGATTNILKEENFSRRR